MAVRAVDHVNIAAQRLEEMRAFFVKILAWWKAVLRRSIRPAIGHPELHMQAADLDGLLARLDARRVAYDLLTVPGSKVCQAFFDDPNGVRVELNYRPQGQRSTGVQPISPIA